MTRILVMTDSTCDLPPAWIRRFDIRVVPTYVQFGMESFADDGVQLTRQDFYERLTTVKTLPKTAAPPPGQVIQIMRQALQDADHVIALTAPALLSGIHNTFRLAAQETDPARVTLLDSGSVSMGLGWQVLLSAEKEHQGASPTDIADAVRAAQPYTDLWATLDTLEYLRRSGRVGWATAFVGDLFRIKPMIRLKDGVVSSVSRSRTSRRAFDTLVAHIHEAAPLERLAILHSNHRAEAQRLANALDDIKPDYEVPIVDVTPVLGVHVGSRALGVAVIRKAQ